MNLAIMTINELIGSIGSPEWDLLIIADAAGQSWDEGMGWAAVTIDRQSGIRRAFNGGLSHGSINHGEAVAALHCIRHDFYKTNDAKLSCQRKVSIVSDSEVTVQTGNGVYRTGRHNNPDIWHTYDFFRAQGYVFNFHLIPRNSNPLAVAVDLASKQGRMLKSGLEGLEAEIYDLMPMGPPLYATPPT